jgi:hypothetical protein
MLTRTEGERSIRLVTADATAGIVITMNKRDAERLELLDRIAARVPEIDLEQHEVKWTTLPDGHEALMMDGAAGYFANHGDDLHAIGSLAPVVEGTLGCFVIKPDGSRYLAYTMPDPLAGHKPD